ncbi:class I SAM-dependent methyltransferase [Gracilibacillus sp. YIM 98692]|uniref:class I SAM-dependent methyltransferase n=1 Tax=Gracilibacillus sp. YIM 98692 TaxID=2663532 RepID=UPI0013D55D82|nr:class I SAM-dependent methyltransferase [Gracilibacillus sp. YIM 98692]
MIITTAGRSTNRLITHSKRLSATYQLPFIERKGQSIENLKKLYKDDILVVGKDQLFISCLDGDQKLFFHPNLAMVRSKRVVNGEEEPFLSTTKLIKGMSILDCTLGLASDSIIASLAVGAGGSVIGIEGSKSLYILAKEGLSSLNSRHEWFDQAMRRISVIHDDHYSYLKKAETNAVDIVYFDPMFHKSIHTSNGINPLRKQAISSDLTMDVIKEAKRVARQRVVIKDHWQSERFNQFGFIQFKRKTSPFHYGSIELY